LPPAAKVTVPEVFRNAAVLNHRACVGERRCCPWRWLFRAGPAPPPVHVSNPGKFNALVEPAIVPEVKLTAPAIVTGLASLKLTIPPAKFVGPVTPYEPVKAIAAPLKFKVPAPLIGPLRL